jgi:tRNA threonylcarbamoyladenosine modification (KEOPS) complex Cgi121 subunit
MTTPASAIEDEVRVLIAVQIETFRQTTPLTSSQLRKFHRHSEKLKMLCQELDRIGTRSVIEQELRRAA